MTTKRDSPAIRLIDERIAFYAQIVSNAWSSATRHYATTILMELKQLRRLIRAAEKESAHDPR